MIHTPIVLQTHMRQTLPTNPPRAGATARIAAVFSALIWLGITASAESPFSVTKIEADGVRLPLPASPSEAVALHTNIRALDLTFAPEHRKEPPPIRIRYQLMGFDSQWRDPVSAMRFAIRFNDAAGNTISGEEFDAHGESEGWTGTLETSRFTERSEVLEVPQGTARLQVLLSSAGPHQAMGVYALDDLVMTLVPLDSTSAPQRIPMIPDEGAMMGTSAGTPVGWARHGTSLGIAQIEPRAGKSPLIVIRDDRADAFGGWLTTGNKTIPIQGIAKIIIHWREAYSIGLGGTAHVSYPYLPVGDYRMRLQAFTIDGRPHGTESAMRVVVVPPFYDTRAFALSLAVLAAIAIGLIVRQVTRQRMQRRLDSLERERVVEQERRRIARDLHDNLGADLTHLALLSDLAKTDAGDAAKAQRHFDQIFDLAQSLTRQVDEMVWAVNPANDSLKGFVPFLSNYAQNYLLAAGIPCRLDIPSSFSDAPLSSTQRHHLFLIVKESLHNIVKHAGASEAWLRIRTDDHRLKIRIQDNGRGIKEPALAGDGTGNMNQRITSLGGTLKRTSESNNGTTVSVALPLTPNN